MGKRNENHQAEINWRMRKRSHRITLCLFSFISAICCLTPFTSIHLTQRVGLLLFESDLIQLRSSLICVIICFIFLVLFNFIIYYLGKDSIKKSERLQTITSKLLSLLASISAISYLAIILLVPHIRQIQRMPTASFDCNANLITIENCQQQFTTQNGEQTLDEAIWQLLIGDLNGNNERLIKKLSCIKFNNRELKTLQVPTRFLLHNCGLVCKPHEQQLHQFSDDLNKDQNQILPPNPDSEQANNLQSNIDSHIIVPPYSRASAIDTSSDTVQAGSKQTNIPNQVSMKVCFSGEFDSGSNYKQFCITNLASSSSSSSSSSGSRQQDHELTVGQLNAMLKSIVVSSSQNGKDSGEIALDSGERLRSQSLLMGDHSTSYANPVVQFESHFKNWPNLPTIIDIGASPPYEELHDGINSRSNSDNWCNFRPIPPFIVNNKPFSDIQCSLEHEYTMTTGPSLEAARQFSGPAADRIYLKKSTMQLGTTESLARERCNIQCRVNILYQVHVKNHQKSKQTATEESTNYYLPLRPCVIVSGEGEKATTSYYYLIFRSIADASLFMVFILIDCILLLETIYTKKFQFESQRLRLIGLLIIVTLVPIIVALVFDLFVEWAPAEIQAIKSKRDSYLINLFNEKIIPGIVDLFNRFTSSNSKLMETSRQHSTAKNVNDTVQVVAANHPSTHNIDNYMIPFFLYGIFMFSLAINSFTLPIASVDTPLIKVSSVEELGIEEEKKLNKKILKNTSKSTNKKQVFQGYKSQTLDVVLFANIVLFMGLQFNISQFIQTQIFIDSFGNPGTASGKTFAAFWFIFCTHSGALMIIMVSILVFLDEISAFFANFSPFSSSAFIEDTNLGSKKSRIRLARCLTISLFTYSARYYFMSILSPMSRFKWLIVTLIQLAEFLNFPLTWFALVARAHELFMEHPTYVKYRVSKKITASQTRAFDIHIAIQSALAFTYFVGARFVAIFSHSIHASLHLHSDNVDWFLTSFYRPPSTQSNQSNGRHNNTTSTNDHTNLETATRGDSLFSALPDERQTYMFASKLFIKYNSILCLILAMIVLSMLLYLKYQLWAEDRQTLRLAKQGFADGSNLEDSDNDIDARLRADLLRMRTASNTRIIYPNLGPPKKMKISAQSGSRDSDLNSPRAKILFHYNLNRGDDSSDENLTEVGIQQQSKTEERPTPVKVGDDFRNSKTETVVPIELAEDDNYESDGGQFADDEVDDKSNRHKESRSRLNVEESIEKVVKQRIKRVRIFEDGDDWSKTNAISRSMKYLDKDSNLEHETINDTSRHMPSKKRTISFAPTTILIDNEDLYSSSSDKYRQTVRGSQPPRRASPEPSIGEENLDSIDEVDSVEN